MVLDYDVLLEYLSYKDCGKYIDFKNYVKNLIYDEEDVISFSYIISQVRRTLSALGHVEFLFNGDKQIFKAAPPVISILPNDTKGVLCGYRTQEFLKELKKYCNDKGLNYSEEKNYKAPQVIFIDFKSQNNINDIKLSETDVKVVTDFSKKLLYVYPTINDVVVNIMKKSVPLDDVGSVKYYDEYNNKFEGFCKDYCVCETTNCGLPKYYIYRNEINEEYFEVDKYTAIINQYRIYRQKIFKLKDNKLKVYYIEGLPDLIDRALTLASGINRKKENNSIIYDNINEELMVLLCEKTGLEVKNG